MRPGATAFAGTDGSGGDRGTDPRLRITGWSYIVFQDNVPVIWGYGGAGEESQTVPVAELLGLLAAARRTAGDLTVYVDNQYVVDTFWLAQWPLQGVHGHLWGQLREVLTQRTGTLSVTKVASHKPQMVEEGTMSLQGYIANELADKLADAWGKAPPAQSQHCQRHCGHRCLGNRGSAAFGGSARVPRRACPGRTQRPKATAALGGAGGGEPTPSGSHQWSAHLREMRAKQARGR